MHVQHQPTEISVDTVIALADLNQLKNETLFNGLSAYINRLIQANFEKLVQVLYRIDVGEEKLKYLLHHHRNENAGDIIAKLIIDRQIQKIQFKQEMAAKIDQECDEERW